MVSYKGRKQRKKRVEQQETRILINTTIKFLIEESMKLRTSDPQRSHQLFIAAKKIGKRNRTHLPRRSRLFFCKSCKFPLTATTARIRLNSKKKQIHYQCLKCNKEQRFGYRKAKNM